MARTRNGTPKLDSLKHHDKRKNIPTEELRGFVREAEQKPKEVKLPGLLYARYPSPDPQLAWKGKDEQDRQELTVPAVNNHGEFGRWAFVEIADPWNAKNAIRTTLQPPHAKRQGEKDA